MSLYQCDNCGCLENSVYGNYHLVYSMNKSDHPAMASYREILGLKPDEPFGQYCSACDPTWFTDKGDYGIGPSTEAKTGRTGRRDHPWRTWHGSWTRMFLPKGEFETAPNGNLRHKVTKDEDVRKYALNKEDLK